MKVTIEFGEFSPWSGAVDTWNKIKDAGLIDQFEAELETMYEDGISDTQLNDLLWFDSDWCLELVGLNEEGKDEEEDDDDKDDEDFNDFCNSFNKCTECPLNMCKTIDHCQLIFNEDKNKWMGYVQNDI